MNAIAKTMTAEQVAAREAVRAEVLENFRGQLTEARLALDCLAVNVTYWIVKTGDEALKFEYEATGRLGVRVTTVANASRYPQRGAIARASEVRNGAGTRGQAHELQAALVEDIAKLEGLISQFEAV